MKKQQYTFQTNKQKQDKSLEADPNETEINYSLNRELKIMVIKMLTKIRGAMYEQSKNFNKEKIQKNIKQNS